MALSEAIIITKVSASAMIYSRRPREMAPKVNRERPLVNCIGCRKRKCDQGGVVARSRCY